MTTGAAPDPTRTTARQWGLFGTLGVAALLVLGAAVWTIVAPAGCACSRPGPTLPPSPVVGVVVSVDSAGLGQVRGFELRVSGGMTHAFVLGPLENATEFPPGHLAEHQASSEMVRAFYRMVDGVPTVYRLEDAPQ